MFYDYFCCRKLSKAVERRRCRFSSARNNLEFLLNFTLDSDEHENVFRLQTFFRDKIFNGIKMTLNIFSPPRPDFFSIRLDSRKKHFFFSCANELLISPRRDVERAENMKKKNLFAREQTAKRFSSFYDFLVQTLSLKETNRFDFRSIIYSKRRET
jgi:hypothetical protein